MSTAEVGGVERKEESREQERRAGKGGDPSSPGKFRNKCPGLQEISFRSTEFFEVVHLVTCRTPEKYKQCI